MDDYVIEQDYLIKVPNSDFGFSEELEEDLKEKINNKIENIFYTPQLRKYKIALVLDNMPTNFALHRPEVLSDLFTYSDLLKSNGYLNSEKTNPTVQEFEVYGTALGMLPLIRTETITSYGDSKGLYTGVREDVIFPGTLFEAVRIMKLIDFGNEEYEAFQIFKPVFDNLKQNIKEMYREYKDTIDEEKRIEEARRKKKNEQEPDEDTQKANRVFGDTARDLKASPAKEAGKKVPTLKQLLTLNGLIEARSKQEV